MNPAQDYLNVNRESWNQKTDIHWDSEFYDLKSFLGGQSSLKEIELAHLGDIRSKRILHLQCHFGQDSISLSRLGAAVTGADLSDRAIERARELASQCGADTQFICCNIYDLPQHCHETFDLVFTSYGTIGWLPDLTRWAAVIAHFLKPGGRFVFAEFHPAMWMFDDDFTHVGYNYFNDGPIVETQSGTYADREAPLHQSYVMWNHGIGEVLGSLLQNGLRLTAFEEYDYSPWNCVKHTVEAEPGKFHVAHVARRIPMVYALTAVKE